MKKVIKMSLVLLFVGTISTWAQNVPLSGSFTVNGQTFDCSSWSPSYDPNRADKILKITNSICPTSFPASAYESTTCTQALNSFEMTKYSFAKNRANTLQLVGQLKTTFSLTRCNQLDDKYFGVNIAINPSNNNSVIYIDYIIHSVGTDTYVTQQEIAQLDALIRTSIFTFPKASGICNNVSVLSLRGFPFKFNELYVKPRFSGIDTMFDQR